LVLIGQNFLKIVWILLFNFGQHLPKTSAHGAKGFFHFSVPAFGKTGPIQEQKN